MITKDDLLAALALADHHDFTDTEFCDWLIETAQNISYQPTKPTPMPGQLHFAYKTERTH